MMYDAKHFRAMLYGLLMLGVTGFSVAVESPGLWLLSGAAIILHAWLVKTGRFIPLPWFVSNPLAILAAILLAIRILGPASNQIAVIGEFLIFMQLIRLYQEQSRGAYISLLLLGLCLMVAGALTTASLIFFLICIAYIFLALYCWELFHLKNESESAAKWISVPARTVAPQVLKQDQRYMNVSMRKLTAVTAAAALACSVVIFLFFPRGAGAGLIAQIQLQPPAQTLTGFSEEVNFQQVARISQNQEKVAYVTLMKDGRKVEGTETLLLRGLTLNYYTGDAPQFGAAWQWVHNMDSNRMDEAPPDLTLSPGDSTTLTTRLAGGGNDVYRATVTLLPNGSRVLFSPGSPLAINYDSGNREIHLSYAVADRTLEAADRLDGPITYTVDCSSNLGGAIRLPGWITPNIDSKIREYAQRPEVSGSDGEGLLYKRRGAAGVPGPLDESIAHNIAHHLQTQFTYTLDLTDTRRLKDEDPLVAFLYRFKRGHCEYFAGAMALMCQSLGMPARVVIGFKCDEYNPLLGQYVVKQSHAHAWCEVLTPQGWKTYDPTSAQETFVARTPSTWDKLQSLTDYLEYLYAANVVAYDRTSREGFMNRVHGAVAATADRGRSWISAINDWLDSAQFWIVSSKLIALLLGILLVALVLLISYFVFERFKLRRRARRIGLGTLPVPDRIRLARQLLFYDDLMRSLARRRIERKASQTPLEFTQSLSFLPSEAYDAVCRLTEIYYRVRYGQAEISAAQQRHLKTVVTRVETSLARGN